MEFIPDPETYGPVAHDLVAPLDDQYSPSTVDEEASPRHVPNELDEIGEAAGSGGPVLKKKGVLAKSDLDSCNLVEKGVLAKSDLDDRNLADNSDLDSRNLIEKGVLAQSDLDDRNLVEKGVLAQSDLDDRNLVGKSDLDARNLVDKGFLASSNLVDPKKLSGGGDSFSRANGNGNGKETESFLGRKMVRRVNVEKIE